MKNEEILRNADNLLKKINEDGLRQFKEKTQTYGDVELNITIDYLQHQIIDGIWSEGLKYKDKIPFPPVIEKIFEDYDTLSRNDIGLVQTASYDDADDESKHGLLRILEHIIYLQDMEEKDSYITWYGSLIHFFHESPEWRHLAIGHAQLAMRTYVAMHAYPALAKAGKGSDDLASFSSLLHVMAENTDIAWWGYFFDILALHGHHFQLLLPCAVLTAGAQPEIDDISYAVDSMISHLPAPAVLHYVDEVAFNLCKRMVTDLDDCCTSNGIGRSAASTAKQEMLTELVSGGYCGTSRHTCPPSFDSQLTALRAKSLARKICAASDMDTLRQAHAELQDIAKKEKAIIQYIVTSLSEEIISEDVAILRDTGVDLPPLFATLLDLYFSLDGKLRNIELCGIVPEDDELDLD